VVIRLGTTVATVAAAKTRLHTTANSAPATAIGTVTVIIVVSTFSQHMSAKLHQSPAEN